jgi:magnesium transporter
MKTRQSRLSHGSKRRAARFNSRRALEQHHASDQSAGVQEAQEVDESYADYFHSEPAGSLPGTLIIPEDAVPPKIVLIDYNETNATRIQLSTPEECTPYLDTESVSWIDVQGLGSEDVLLRLGQVFQLHPLALEDVVNVPQRPKVEEYEDQLVIITRMVVPRQSGGFCHKEQVSFILGKHYLLTVQEEPKRDTFHPVRDRIRTNKGSIRKRGADHLAYTLIDTIIDGFFPVLESYGELIEDLEEEVVSDPTHKTLEKIHTLKRELLNLRRAIWPQRDAINSLIRDENHLISSEVRIYLRDCADHATQVLDMVETYRELASSLMDIYVSSVGNRMNEIMKLLTVISSIFIPLTFIAGIYGMNFNTERSRWNMPELDWPYGYLMCWAVMITIAAGMIYFFWRKGWFENVSTIKTGRKS